MKKFYFLLLAVLPVAGAGQYGLWSNNWSNNRVNDWSGNRSQFVDTGNNTPEVFNNCRDFYWTGVYYGDNWLADPLSQ